MTTTKWTYPKEWSFASNYLIFLENLFQFRTPWKELLWCVNDPNVNICVFRKCWSLILGCFFPVSILKAKIGRFLRDWHVFVWQLREVLNVFDTFALKQIIWKTKTFIKKLVNHFLVENTKIESATLSYKTTFRSQC